MILNNVLLVNFLFGIAGWHSNKKTEGMPPSWVGPLHPISPHPDPTKIKWVSLRTVVV